MCYKLLISCCERTVISTLGFRFHTYSMCASVSCLAYVFSMSVSQALCLARVCVWVGVCVCVWLCGVCVCVCVCVLSGSLRRRWTPFRLTLTSWSLRKP